jgi:SufS family cysteine desulfurase
MRKEFPIFAYKESLNEPFVYLDNAATTQKPQVMIDALVDFYTKYNANIHRGVYPVAETATRLFEDARTTIAQLIGAHADEIVWVKNATEGINLVASAWALQHMQPGDEILLTEYEHHANLLPWQRVAQQTGAKLIFVPVLPDGTLDFRKLSELCTQRCKLVACTAVSNVTGAHTDLEIIIPAARAVGAKVLIDASQAAAHSRIDLATMQADFLVFSGHKTYGPTGIGVLYIKKELQEETVPYQLGGGMVYEADYSQARFARGPHKFEAGTPPIAEAVALAAALRWLYAHDIDAICAHEATLLTALIDGLQGMPEVRILGPIEELKEQGSLVSFIVNGMHAHDVAAFLGERGIAARAGHHCAQPLAKKWHIEASVRMSVACYNTRQEIEYALSMMQELRKYSL